MFLVYSETPRWGPRKGKCLLKIKCVQKKKKKEGRKEKLGGREREAFPQILEKRVRLSIDATKRSITGPVDTIVQIG